MDTKEIMQWWETDGKAALKEMPSFIAKAKAEEEESKKISMIYNNEITNDFLNNTHWLSVIKEPELILFKILTQEIIVNQFMITCTDLQERDMIANFMVYLNDPTAFKNTTENHAYGNLSRPTLNECQNNRPA